MQKRILKCTARVLNIAVTAVLALLLTLQFTTLLVRAVRKDPYASVLGYHSAVVLTGSMADAINPNDLIITKAQDQYAVGDIVTYRTAGASVTHRIIERTDNGWITKGDANNTPDGEIDPSSIVGKVVLIIPRIGAIITFMRTPLGMLCMVALLFVLLILTPVKKEHE